MGNESKSFLLFVEQREAIGYLTDEEAGRLIKSIYDYADEGIIPQLGGALMSLFSQGACLFFGLKEMPDILQLRKLTMIIAANFGYLKVDELQLFFFNFCSGKYRHFFNTFDPYIILQSIRDFLAERARAIELREQKKRELEWEESKRNAITYEEYLERKKAAEASAQDATDMKT